MRRRLGRRRLQPAGVPENRGGAECSGKGLCSGGACFCPLGSTGDDCGSNLCPSDCSHNGMCDGGKCVCFDGFEGADCSKASHDRNKRCATRCADICVDQCRPLFARSSSVAGRSCYLSCSRDCYGRCVKAGFELATPAAPCSAPECQRMKAAPVADPLLSCTTVECQKARAAGDVVVGSAAAARVARAQMHSLTAQAPLLPAGAVSLLQPPRRRRRRRPPPPPCRRRPPPSEALTKLEQRAVDQLESLVASGLGPRVGARHAEARPAAAGAGEGGRLVREGHAGARRLHEQQLNGEGEKERESARTRGVRRVGARRVKEGEFGRPASTPTRFVHIHTWFGSSASSASPCASAVVLAAAWLRPRSSAHRPSNMGRGPRVTASRPRPAISTCICWRNPGRRSFAARTPRSARPCRAFSAKHLTLHGLWPGFMEPRDGATYPSSCAAKFKLLTDQMPRDYIDVAPSFTRWDPERHIAIVGDLAKHEYKKHGSCSGLPPAQYFDEALRAMRELPGDRGTPEMLTRNVGGTVDAAALRGEYRKRVALSADKHCRPRRGDVLLAQTARRLRRRAVRLPAARDEGPRQWPLRVARRRAAGAVLGSRQARVVST